MDESRRNAAKCSYVLLKEAYQICLEPRHKKEPIDGVKCVNTLVLPSIREAEIEQSIKVGRYTIIEYKQDASYLSC